MLAETVNVLYSTVDSTDIGGDYYDEELLSNYIIDVYLIY